MEAKKVSWATVRDIANSLTNQLYLADGEVGECLVDVEEAHLSHWQQGPRRLFRPEGGKDGEWFRPSQEATGRWLPVGKEGDGWRAFQEGDVCALYWESQTSGSGLLATKQEPGVWLLEFIPSERNPDYRGAYYSCWEDPNGVKNVDSEYAYQYRSEAAAS